MSDFYKFLAKYLLTETEPINGENQVVSDIHVFLAAYLPSIKNSVVVEVGAARGEDTPKILSYCDVGTKYYAFEPDPRNIPVFRQKMTDPRITFVESAVGSFIGRAHFYLSVGFHPWSSSLRKPKDHLKVSPHITFEESCEVAVDTLDNYFRDFDHIDFMWCDAQGGEIDIIRGGSKTLPEIDYMYMEYSDKEMYEGQAVYSELVEAVKEHFTVLYKFEGQPEGDVLFKNKRLA